MIAFDTNVLVYAHRSELPEHEAALAILEEATQGDLAFGVPALVIGEFLRVATHPRVLDPRVRAGLRSRCSTASWPARVPGS